MLFLNQFFLFTVSTSFHVWWLLFKPFPCSIPFLDQYYRRECPTFIRSGGKMFNVPFQKGKRLLSVVAEIMCIFLIAGNTMVLLPGDDLSAH